MLATECEPLATSPEISGLKTWKPKQSEKIVPMRHTKKEGYSQDLRKKAVVYSNLVHNPFEAAHDIMFSHGRMRDSEFMASAIYEFSESEWEFLEMASGELARLVRMAEILPDFFRMIKYPDRIAGNFFWPSCDYPEELYSSLNSGLAENVLRYRLSMYVAIGGALFSIFTWNHSKPLARAICAVLFSRPYRQDWLDCPLREIEDDVEYLAGLFAKHSTDFNYDAWTRELNETGCLQMWGCKLYDLITNCQVLRQMSRARGDGDRGSVYVEPKPRLAFAGMPLWFSDLADICESPRNVSPLPSTAMALVANRISGAVVPMYPALDECDLPVALVPESKTVWDAMIRIYGMARHDELYPEAPSIQLLMSPKNTHFSQEMAERYNLIYLGTQSLGKYVEGIGKLEESGANQDYQFHAFAVGQESGTRRNRR